MKWLTWATESRLRSPLSRAFLQHFRRVVSEVNSAIRARQAWHRLRRFFKFCAVHSVLVHCEACTVVKQQNQRQIFELSLRHSRTCDLRHIRRLLSTLLFGESLE